MTYYIFIETYEGRQIKLYASSAIERDSILRFYDTGIKFKAWVTSNGKSFKILDIANLDIFFPCDIKYYDSIGDILCEIRYIEIYLAKELYGNDPLLCNDIIKKCRESENFLMHFNSFIGDLR